MRRIVQTIDLFKFYPVPKEKPVRSMRSLMGSLLLLIIFFTYLIYELISRNLLNQDFIQNNQPRVNSYSQIQQNSTQQLPEIAFAFFYDNSTINDLSIFTFQYQQIIKYRSISQPQQTINVDLINCNPTWLTDLTLPVLCPMYLNLKSSQTLNMSGGLYQTAVYQFPRISVKYCNSSIVQCVPPSQLFNITANGNILLYIKENSPDATDQTVQYSLYQFFLMPGFYGKSSINFQYSRYTKQPDYLTRFQVQSESYLQVSDTQTDLTNVTIYNNLSAYSIAFQLDQTEQIITLTYATVLDMISLWGAFWGVLFSAFATYFLYYNKNSFYAVNDNWSNFDRQLTVHQVAIESEFSNKVMNLSVNETNSDEQF